MGGPTPSPGAGEDIVDARGIHPGDSAHPCIRNRCGPIAGPAACAVDTWSGLIVPNDYQLTPTTGRRFSLAFEEYSNVPQTGSIAMESPDADLDLREHRFTDSIPKYLRVDFVESILGRPVFALILWRRSSSYRQFGDV